MSTSSHRDGHNRFRGLRAILRFPWQRRSNTVPSEAAPVAAIREASNDGFFAAPVSDRRGEDVVPPLAPGNEAVHYLMHDHAQPPIEEKNPAHADLWLADLALWRDRSENDFTNRPDPAALPDAKAAGDYAPDAKNYEAQPLFITDPDLSKRLKFTRFLVQRGTFNEGFVPDEQLEPYHTRGDLFDDTDDIRKDYD